MFWWKKKVVRRPILAIDLDDTLSEFCHAWVNMYNVLSGDSLTVEECTEWNISENVLPEWKNKIFELLTDSRYSTNIVNGTKPIQGAIESTKRLQEFFDIYIVTATHPENFAQKIKWLQYYFPHIPSVNVISMVNKSLFSSDYLIDDKTATVREFPNQAILFTRPWNKKYFSFSIPRFSNWTRLENYLMREWKSKWQHATQNADGFHKIPKITKNT